MSSPSDTGGSPQFTRFFTVEEANALLQNLRPAVEEMMQIFKEIQAEIQTTAREFGISVESADLSRHLQERGVTPRLFERLRILIDSIHENGCLVNGPEAGLIDFPAMYGSEIVFLCWKHGEPGVNHWHRIPDGFAGRKPLLDASEEGAEVH